MQSHKSNQIQMLKRFQLYYIFSKYYKGVVWDMKSWANVVDLVADYISYKSNHHMESGFKLLKDITEEEIHQAVYDYNRLFVGPDKLLAPPFESYYRNPEKLIMQQETLKVRDFYKKVGLQVVLMGKEPDDHLGYELELACYLLSQNNEEMYWEFFQEHLEKWVSSHCDDVLKNSTTKICQGMALVLKGSIELEKQECNLFRGGDKGEQRI